MSAFLALMRRDLALAFRIGGGGLLSLGFFLLAALLIPLGVGPEGQALTRIAAGVVWVCALLACLLSLDRLFQADLEDGSLDQLALGPLPLEAIVLAKAAAHWISTGLPLTLAAPAIGVMLNLDPQAFGALLLALLIGTPALSLVGAVGAGLTAGVRRGGLLLSVLVLPLYVPTLIFGAQAADRAATGLDPLPALAFLGAVTALAAGVSPFAAAAALRVNLR
ncbi:heme exporter protein CcmB [Albimonas sp. CAU 1670]|uniref:heme exporter protein CcmB n=1 Tax=Albimonas sp. CAU 1670 TaxID=3032599 RepID=UPI0023DCE30B|nr:heme exporter protein CcmB [Albimonas sp. CAU 1670]MDF2233271.1 heme exporter protein CcmB [Albimonas sp. CAU 1670]